MNFEQWFQAKNSDIAVTSAQAVIRLSNEGATLPFIARYRKEQTGNLNEVDIQRVIDAKKTWDELETRKTFVLGEIESQGKLTDELRESIQKCFDPGILEDLYLPYKKKKKTRAMIAREAGLEPLADRIWRCGHGEETWPAGETVEKGAEEFVNAEKGVADAAGAIEGAQHIIVERLSEMADLRQFVRSYTFAEGTIQSRKTSKAKPNSKFERYFEYFEAVPSLMKPQNSHRYLAMRRGETEEELGLNIGGKTAEDTSFNDYLLKKFEAVACTHGSFPGAALLLKAAKSALNYYVRPSIDSEVHMALKTAADEAAIQVFADNVRTILLAPPFGSKMVLGVDPGIRTGCKLALVDESGKYVGSGLVHLTNDSEKAKTRALIKDLGEKKSLLAIAVGNGTAGREAETFFRSLTSELKLSIPVVMVSEAGASVYSASEVARQEFPDLDVTVRGAISIARRLQDPLAELVKIDPKSIGVGQYQHDVSPYALKDSLERVMESCVNSVGVNLNTASEYLLSFVSGIGPSLAKAIVAQRNAQGLFKSRKDLLSVSRFGSKAYEQAAGFLRIANGTDPLDNTGVHPERYAILENHARRLNKKVADFLGAGVALLKADQELRKEVGDFTFDDIVRELEKPGRDPRDTFVPFEFREDIHEIADLQPGMICPGIVTNVTNFGAFVDIGVHQDGLVHISHLSDKFVKDAKEVVSPGDRVKVKVMEVNIERKQISLSMRVTDEARPAGARAPGAVKVSSGKGGDRRAGGGARQPAPESFKNTPFAGLSGLGKGRQ